MKRARREKARRKHNGLFSNFAQRQTKAVKALVRAECERTELATKESRQVIVASVLLEQPSKQWKVVKMGKLS